MVAPVVAVVSPIGATTQTFKRLATLVTTDP